MARKLTAQDVARGKRLTEIREALKMTQAAMVPMLNAAAKTLGVPQRYEYWVVSRMEAGSITFEDAAAWLLLDPARKPGEPPRWDWFVLGDRVIGNLAPNPGATKEPTSGRKRPKEA